MAEKSEAEMEMACFVLGLVSASCEELPVLVRSEEVETDFG